MTLDKSLPFPGLPGSLHLKRGIGGPQIPEEQRCWLQDSEHQGSVPGAWATLALGSSLPGTVGGERSTGCDNYPGEGNSQSSQGDPMFSQEPNGKWADGPSDSLCVGLKGRGAGVFQEVGDLG